MVTMEDVIKFLDDNKEDEAVISFVDGIKGDSGSAVNLDTIKQLSEEDKDVRSWLDSVKDSHANKSLETWKKNHLSKLIDDEIKSRLPQEEQEELAINQLKKEIEEMKREKVYGEQKILAFETAQSRGIPTALVDFFIGDNDEATIDNLSKLEKAFSKSLEEQVKVRLKETSYTPPKSTASKAYSIDDLGSMTPEEINRFYDERTKK